MIPLVSQTIKPSIIVGYVEAGAPVSETVEAKAFNVTDSTATTPAADRESI